MLVLPNLMLYWSTALLRVLVVHVVHVEPVVSFNFSAKSEKILLRRHEHSSLEGCTYCTMVKGVMQKGKVKGHLAEEWSFGFNARCSKSTIEKILFTCNYKNPIPEKPKNSAAQHLVLSGLILVQRAHCNRLSSAGQRTKTDCLKEL